eukprot:4511520-Pleurochrysis_carterae.AAC.1
MSYVPYIMLVQPMKRMTCRKRRRQGEAGTVGRLRRGGEEVRKGRRYNVPWMSSDASHFKIHSLDPTAKYAQHMMMCTLMSLDRNRDRVASTQLPPAPAQSAHSVTHEGVSRGNP